MSNSQEIIDSPIDGDEPGVRSCEISSMFESQRCHEQNGDNLKLKTYAELFTFRHLPIFHAISSGATKLGTRWLKAKRVTDYKACSCPSCWLSIADMV